MQRIANDALDLAVAKNMSYSDAVTTLNLALQGNTRGLRDLGLSSVEVNAIMKEAPNSLKDVTKAQNEVEKTSNELTKAQEALKVEEDTLHGKRVVTKVDLDHLKEKQDAVTKAAAAYKKAQDDLNTAQNGVVVSTKAQSDLLDKVEPKIKGARDATSDQEQATHRLSQAWDRFTANVGSGALPALDGMKNKTADLITVIDHPTTGGSGTGTGSWQSLAATQLNFSLSRSGNILVLGIISAVGISGNAAICQVAMDGTFDFNKSMVGVAGTTQLQSVTLFGVWRNLAAGSHSTVLGIQTANGNSWSYSYTMLAAFQLGG